MIACFAWTNTQLINITNAKINLFSNDEADLYIRIGAHMSESLILAIQKSGVYKNVYCLDPMTISTKKLVLGQIPLVRLLFLRHGYIQAYKQLLEHINGIKRYDRAIVSWFYADNVFLLKWWSKGVKNFKITFVDEGTGSYCYTKKQMIFPVSLIGDKKALIKRYLAEYTLSKKMGRKVDTICFYRPEYCRPDIDFKKMKLPLVNKETNPIMWKIMVNSSKSLDALHFNQYEKRKAIYLSTFSIEGKNFDLRSTEMLSTIQQVFGRHRVIAKIHTGNTNHAKNFANSFEKKIYVDRDKYIFEGLYMQLPERAKKVLVSCISTAAIYPKFMFGDEPYLIFTFRLYDTYRQVGVERDDWMCNAVIDAYEDKSKVMVPNSMLELKQMLKRIKPHICDEYLYSDGWDDDMISEELPEESPEELPEEETIKEEAENTDSSK